MYNQADAFASIDWLSVRGPEEAVAITRIEGKIAAVHQESRIRGLQQREEIISAWDELDFEMYRAFSDHERQGI